MELQQRPSPSAKLRKNVSEQPASVNAILFDINQLRKEIGASDVDIMRVSHWSAVCLRSVDRNTGSRAVVVQRQCSRAPESGKIVVSNYGTFQLHLACQGIKRARSGKPVQHAGYRHKAEQERKKEFFAMNCNDRMQGTLFRTLPLLLTLFLSGCAIIGQQPDAASDAGTTEPDPSPAQETAVASTAGIPTISEPEPFPQRAAIVLSDRNPAYENIATELGKLLQDYSIYDLTDKSLTPRAVFSNIADFDAGVVIAIGLRAATVANAYSKVPVVFCQVFNIADIDLDSDNLKGVAALPPLSMQIAAWQELNPGLSNVGAIVGGGHEVLIDEANMAAVSAGLTFHYRIARSDRETLYMFNRLARGIDGFWLFPDNRILSPYVLREMLSYASRHRIQVAVFNPVLLDFGAALSTTSVDSDIAATVVAVAHRVMRGDGESIPTVTPLNAIDVQTNRAVFTKPEVAAANGGGAP